MSEVKRITLSDFIQESFSYLREEGDMIPFGMGKCTGCGKLLYPGEEEWNGKEFGHHYPEYDAGGGNVKKIQCGEIVRSDYGGKEK